MPTISGSVLFDSVRAANGTGTPIPNIPIILQNTSTGVGLVVLTATNGTYSFTSVPAGTYRLVEGWGTTGGIASPGDFTTATTIPQPTPQDPPVSAITAVTSPPVGTNRIDSLSPNTINLTMVTTNITGQNFIDAPTEEIFFTANDLTVIGPNLITSVNNGYWGTLPAGTSINTRPASTPYPGAVPDFTYINGTPNAGQYTVSNITRGLLAVWWNTADHTTGDETGRYEIINGAPVGNRFFSETVSVTPNTFYLFSSWFLNLVTSAGYPAGPGVKISTPGGATVFSTGSKNIPSNTSIAIWNEIGAVFNSGNNTTLVVNFLDVNGGASGNDYAADDFSLVPVSVNNILSPVTKSVDLASAQVGTTLTYTISFKNNGLSTAQSIHLIDTLPSSVTFVNNSLYVNGVTTIGNLSSLNGITIPNLASGATTTISYKVVVNTVPVGTTILNGASINYAIAPISSFPDTIPLALSSNIVSTQVKVLSLTSIAKSVDTFSASPGDTLTYSVSYFNEGNQVANNIVLSDTIPPGTTFVPNSLAVNGITIPNADPTPPGTSIPDAAPRSSTTVTFQVVVDANPTVTIVSNQVILSSLTPSTTIPNIDSSNVIITNLNYPILSAIKSVNNNSAIVGDTLTYTITLNNTSNTAAINSILVDTLTAGINFIPGSVMIAGASSSASPITGITIPNIPANGSVILVFKASATSIPNPNPFVNLANLFYKIGSLSATLPISGGSVTVTLPTPANINSPTKTSSNSTPQLGDVVIYDIILNNSGQTPATNVILTDILTSGINFIPKSTTVEGVSTSDSPLTGINVGTIPTGGNIIVSFAIKVDSVPNPNPFVNTAIFNYNNGTTTSNGIVSGGTIDVIDGANLSTSTKGNNVTSATVCQTITYSLTIPNTGAQAATNVTVLDVLPAGLSLSGNPTVSGITSSPTGNLTVAPGLDIGTIPIGNTAIITFNVLVNSVPNPNPFINTATISYIDSNGMSTLPVTGPIGGTIIFPASIANLGSSVKIVDKSDPTVGDTITYTIYAFNTGTGNAINVVLYDTLPLGFNYVIGSAKVGTLPASGTPSTGIFIGTIPDESIKTVTFSVNITSVPNPNPYINTATFVYFNGTTFVTDTVTGGVTDVNPLEGANISTSVKGNNVTSAIVGQIITYSLTIPNTGAQAATNVTVLDVLPVGLSLSGNPVVTGIASNPTGNLTVAPGLNIGTIPIGSTAVVTFNVLVNAVPNPSTFINTATVSYTDSTGTSTIPVIGPINGIPISPAIGANLNSTTKDATASSSVVGSNVAYTITIPNFSTVPAINVIITDILPSAFNIISGPSVTGNIGTPSGNLNTGFNIGTIPGNTTVVVGFVVNITTIPVPNPFTNTATIVFMDPIGTHTLPATGGNLNILPLGGANISTSVKGNNVTSATVGEVITYALTIPNTGAQAATNVTVLDVLPVGLSLSGNPVVTGIASNPTGNLTISPGLNIGTIPIGSTAVVTFNVLVNAVPNPNTFINTATVSYTDSTGISTLPVTGPINGTPISPTIGANLNSTTKGATASSSVVGSNVAYNITIPNSSTVPANNVIITDILPSAFNIISGPIVIGNIGTPSGNLNTGFNIGTISGNTTVVVGFIVNITTIPLTNPFTNTATIVYTDPTGTHTNTISSGSLNIGPASESNLSGSIKGTNSTYADIGNIIPYTITIPNSGTLTALNVNIVDILPTGLELSPNSINVTGSTGPITGDLTTLSGLNIGSILPKTTAVVKFGILVNAIPNPSNFSNKANITYTDSNGKPGKVVTSPVTTNIISGKLNPNNISKTSNRTLTTMGDTITFTITINNPGNTPILNAVISDNLISTIRFLPGSLTINGLTSPNANLINGVSIPNIAPGATTTVTFKTAVVSGAGTTITNTANLNYQYIVNPSQPPINGSISATSPPIYNMDVLNGLIGSKTPNTKFTIVGETVRYTITLTNINPVNLDNVIVTDPLSPSLQYAANLTINGVPSSQSILTGVNIGTLVTNQTTTITFDAIISLVPYNNVIPNIATVDYEFTINSTFSGLKLLSAQIYVYNGNIVAKKTISTDEIIVGTPFNYTITLSNQGTLASDKEFIQDVLPKTFKVLNITVDGVPINGDPNTGFYLGGINPGSTSTIVMTVVATGEVSGNSFENIANITSEFTPDPTQPPVKITKTINQIGGPSKVINPSLKMTKTSNVIYAAVGDTIAYTITVENNGNVDLLNVNISDNLSNGLEFVKNSVTISTESSSDDNIISGIILPIVAIGQIITITYKAVVIAPGTLKNQVDAVYQYEINPNKPLMIGTSSSNINTVNAYLAQIKVTKSSNAKFAVLEDTINYTVVLRNIGSVNTFNVVFKDVLPRYLQLVSGTFTVNNEVINNVDLTSGVNIGEIDVNQVVTINYSAKIISNSCNYKIINDAIVSFLYKLPDGTVGNKDSQQGGDSLNVIDMGISNFKQFSLGEYLAIPSEKPNIESINALNGSIQIIKYHTIKTAKTSSLEGQNLSGNKLIIHGVLRLVIEYTACEKEQSLHSAHYDIPFSTFIVLPIDYSFGSTIEIDGIVEDIYGKEIDCRTLFTNSTILINAKLLFC